MPRHGQPYPVVGEMDYGRAHGCDHIASPQPEVCLADAGIAWGMGSQVGVSPTDQHDSVSGPLTWSSDFDPSEFDDSDQSSDTDVGQQCGPVTWSSDFDHSEFDDSDQPSDTDVGQRVESEPWPATWSSDLDSGFDFPDCDSSDTESSVILTTGDYKPAPAHGLGNLAFAEELADFEQQLTLHQRQQARAQTAQAQQAQTQQLPMPPSPQTPPVGLVPLSPEVDRRILTAADVKAEPQSPGAESQGMDQAAHLLSTLQSQQTSEQKILPDVRTIAQWDLLPTPEPGKPLRWALAGKRFFVQLSREVSDRRSLSPCNLRSADKWPADLTGGARVGYPPSSWLVICLQRWARCLSSCGGL